MKLKHILLVAIGSMAALTAVSCEKKGPAEKAGEKMDDAAERDKDSAEDAKEKAKDAVEDLGDKVEDATDQ